MQTLLVTFLLITTTTKAPLVLRHAVLVRFNGAVLALAVHAHGDKVVWLEVRDAAGGVTSLLLPAKGKVSGRNDLDEVHKVESPLRSILLTAIEGVHASASANRALELLLQVSRELRTEAQGVDPMSKAVRAVVTQVVFQIVHVQVAVAETLAGGEMEIANDFVDADVALNTAAFLDLRVELLGVVLPCALLDALATSE